MANSSAPASTTLYFVGGGQKRCKSVQSQAVDHLDLFCPKWKDGESYIIPPKFSFKNADISDAECMEMEENRILIDRWSEEAEHVVFKAIQQLVAEKEHGPFIAIHGSNLEKIQYHLPMIFPTMKWDGLKTNLEGCFHEQLKESFGWVFHQLAGFFQTIEEKFHRLLQQMLVRNGLFNWNKLIDDMKNSIPEVPDECWKQLRSTIGVHFREIDFFLIGPQIGIIIIEVKGSKFSQTKHFKARTLSLPDNYVEGLKQLETVDLFLDFLQECTGHVIPKESFRKVLFTPNLESGRYEGWLSTLKVHERNSLESKIGNVIQLFWNQLSNKDEHGQKPQLYSALLDIFGKSGSMEKTAYETYSPLIATLSCAIIMPDKTCAVDWSKLDISKALADICSTVERQDPSMPTENYFIGPQYFIGPPQESVIHSEKLIVLTPDQRAALEGPPRQFIFGAAGTGKTIVLQEKALQLFKQSQSVLILAPRNNAERYKHFFESEIANGTCEVKYWPNSALLGDLVFQIETLLKGHESYPHVEIDTISKFIKDEIQHGQENFKQTYFEWLLKYNNVLIDDAFDSLKQQKWIECLAILAFMNHVRPKSNVWIATDTFDEMYYQGDRDPEDWNESLVFSPNLNIMHHILGHDYYSVCFLNQVMRCPSSVFTAVYHPRLAWTVTCRTSVADEVTQELSPKIGHKVPGQEIIMLQEKKESKVEAIRYIWLTLGSMLKRFLLMGIKSTQVCIIADSDGWIKDLVVAIREGNARNGLVDTSLVFRNDGDAKSNRWQLNISGNVFEIWKWDEVSSMEWPIVIFISCYHKHQWSEEHRIESYRALSRALTGGVEIIAKYYGNDAQEAENYDPNHQDCNPGDFQSTQSIDNTTKEFCSMLAEKLQLLPEKKRNKLKTRMMSLIDCKEDSDSD